MKRRIMALLLAATLVFQGVSTVPVFASEAVGETFDVSAKEMFVTLKTGETATLEADVTAPEGAVLTYAWSAMDAQYNQVPLEGDTCTYEITGAPGMYTTYYCDVTCEGQEPGYASFYVTFINIIDGLAEDAPATHTFAQQREQVYFEFVPETTGRYAFSAEGSQLQPALYDAEMVQIQSGSGTDTGFVLETEELTEGTTYYLGVRAYVPGAMTVSVEPLKLSATTTNSDVTVSYGEENTADLVVDVYSATGDEVTYAWYKDSAEEPIEDATAATFTINGLLESAGEYKCVVTCGDIVKEVTFNVTVSTELSASAADGLSFYLLNGESATLEVEVSSLKEESLSYQWGYMDPETYENIDIEGATGTSYVVVKDNDVEVIYYYCYVTDGVEEISVNYIINGVNKTYTFGEEINLPLTMVESGATLTYKFVPTATATYKFVSEGTGYPQMMIKDAAGEYVAEASSIDSPYAGLDEPNLNFELSIDLEKNTTYYLVFGMADSTWYSPVEPSDAVVKATVSSIALEDCEIEIEDVVYNGEAQTPEVTVKFGNQVFENEVDYHVEYSYTAIHPMTGMPMDMQEPAVIGEGKVTVYPLEGALTGEVYGVSKQYTVEKANLANATVVLEDVAYTFDGTAKTPTVESVKIGDLTLTTDDYTVTYDKNTNAGTATVTLTAAEDSQYYTGSVVKTFEIAAASIKGAVVTLDKTSYTYDGLAKTPVVTVKVGNVTLKANTDYTVSYSNNVAAGKATVTVTGKGNYAGTVSATYTINVASINGATVTVDPTSYTYDGTAKVPAVTVKVGNVTLKAGTDYTVAVSNNTNKGTATVVVTGKGNYAGTASATYTINAASIANATVSIASVKYTGKALKPAVTVKVGNVTLKENVDYKVSYSNNKNIGKGKVTITGIGNYTGSLSKNFTIAAKKGDKFTVGSYTYKITGSSTVAFASVVKSKVSKTTTVKVADTVKIGGKTFKVTSILDNALKNNKKVKKVTIGKNVTTIGKSAFEGCTKLATVTIGAKVTKISDKAFKKCTALKKITIPAKVTKIGKEAFYGAKNLKTITVKSTKITSVGKNAFKNINKKATIKVPSKKYSTYSKKTFKGKGQAKTVKIKK